jgi:two-component system CheB/CheR fusion protein
VVRSIARRTAENTEDVETMISHLDGRLNAFSRVQAAVTRDPEGGIDLCSIVEDELLAVATREGEQLRIKGPDVHLKARAAETISLAMHELATNAVKYGALAADRGRIAVTWLRAGENGTERLDLEWAETGARMNGTPEREGFGLELLRRTLPYELGAQTAIEFRKQGLLFRMSMPLRADILAGS